MGHEQDATSDLSEPEDEPESPYDGDVDTESHFSAESFNQASACPNTLNTQDPASYAGRSLSEDDKLKLRTSTWKKPTNFVFPVRSGRRFNPRWLVNRPWLRYSIRNDSIYCNSCVCFLGKKVILSDTSRVKATKLLKKEWLYFCSRHVSLPQILALC